MKRAIIFPLLLFFIITGFAQQSASAPKIVRTDPAFGDCQVDPDLKEIIFEFDQEMSGGMSFPNNNQMPEVTGRPAWIDAKTLSIPVKLDSNKVYRMFCNDWRHRNFRNKDGVPLNPDFLIFQTKGKREQDFNEETYREFIKVFPSRYSYADRKNIDWEELIHEIGLKNSKTNYEFMLKLMAVLKKAEDPHISADYKGEKYAPLSRKFYLPNYNTGEIVRVLDDKYLSENDVVISGTYEDIGYILIATWHISYKDEIRTAIKRLKHFKDLDNIIVDVRLNTGGDENLAREFAACFTGENLPYGKIYTYSEETGKFDRESIKYLDGTKEKFKYEGNVYVLIGPRGLSSNEGFAAMMKEISNVSLVGMNTYGSSGNPLPYKLSEEITLYLPSWIVYTMNDKLIEGNGIEPDILREQTEADFINKDALFEEVVRMIKE